jgi:hypothetical protein
MIIITSHLTKTQRQRINRKARFYEETENIFERAFQHVGRNQYAPLHDVDEHNIARQMMLIAYTTFDYELR